MKNKLVIVTGANSGMGLATTVELARQGATVIMACRNKERGEKALAEAKSRSGSSRIELMLLDLGSLRSIRAFAEAFTAKYEALDVLVNNAGVVSLKRQLTEDGFEVMLGVNHLGHFLLTRLLLDTLLRAEQGRVVNVSSGAYKIGAIHYEDPTLSKRYFVAKGYARSKLANILFTKELARRTKGTSLTVNCLHPGAVATNIGVDRGTGFGKTIVGMLRPFFLTAEQGAETAIYLATSPEVKNISGEYFYKKKPQALQSKATDPQAALKFWGWSEQEVGLHTEE
ncbi:NAD(P)-dependent dehydrogenase (short-subunit alcohol dehydrogenase family) [Paenibacillus shirakamiensis]|uniref:NAD(P)-dependent dehydrogenase (Short-subunit alcohol dehydrogenase family) n=1 Tax=Paenibacillus shirakamiensis TaxID=1265935 RepID=A0ABS4JG73_9BACL|nr:SDR family oxidoreductase [Paenibacillus shirakamiensis]MBP2000713.1 NAD(P)-dependent dehydrogenase (short-subunit alcohol dehydrogenase family) [Paenibacillus shirakamiensis]